MASLARSAAATQLVFIDDLEVWMTRKYVRNLSIYVKPPDGRVEASVPAKMPYADVEKFIASKRSWILKKQRQIVSSPQSRAESASKEEIEEWRRVVRACTPPLVEAWESILGVKAQKIDYRNMKSRWGSCKPSTGRICINIRLALFPPECLEYVVVHELCHLIERGHGKRFYALMDRCMPDWRERRAKLR